MGRLHVATTTETTRRGDRAAVAHGSSHDDDNTHEDHEDDAAPTWATHDPPRPARATLAPHGGGANPFQLPGQRRRAAHKRSAPSESHPLTRNAAGSDGGVAIAVESAAGKRTVYQVVIDKVGHGVAPDPPVLLPEAAPAEVSTQALSFAAVETADMAAAAQREWQWEHRDSIELGLVGVAVLLVAAVVMAVARRQQRAYERQQQQQPTSSANVAGGADPTDVETGRRPTLQLATPGIRATQSDDEIGTPASEDEGIV